MSRTAKPKPKNEELVTLQTMVTRAEMAQIVKLAVSDDRSVSAWARAAIRKELEKGGKS